MFGFDAASGWRKDHPEIWRQYHRIGRLPGERLRQRIKI